MKLMHMAISTELMRHGMTMLDFFTEAVRCNVPGLPYADEQDVITGRISIRDVYKRIAVPDSLLPLADALGDVTDSLDLPEMKVMEMMRKPVEDFLLDYMPTVSPQSSVVKALALMELHNSSYVFLIDDGVYQGVVSRMVIARRMLACVNDTGSGLDSGPRE
ncbi:MAG: CBS domain-containing protein [Gammaproteobacteria bacterium]|nr:CBS domain-containing protein [Gammaproteobacteria bacterium]MCP5299334.1 CBS domain-containing protein [Chromatiaceae bacterium]